jgi:sugar phosphate isomerase/epimerase
MKIRRTVGLAALTVLELAPPEQVKVAAAAGYTHVGLRLIPVANQTLPSFQFSELQARLADSGIKVLDVEVFRLDPQTDVAAFKETLEISQRLGATDLLAHGADPDEARLRDRVAALSDLAAQHGITVNIEPMPWVEVSTVRKAKRAIEGTKAAVLVDAIHFFREDNAFEDLKTVPHRYMQLCDARAETPSDVQEIIRQARGDRLFPGEGGLDLKGLLAALPADLPISIEIPYAKPMPPLERARRALAATQALLC